VSQHRAPKRRADKHRRASLPSSSSSPARSSAQPPASTGSSGRHRAGPATPAVPRERRGFTRPSGFLVAGTSALVVAAAGAMSVGSAQAADNSSSDDSSVQALNATVAKDRSTSGDHTGQDPLGSHLDRDGRPATISRNAGRVALDRAQQRRLERAAEQQAAQRNAALADLASRAEDRAEQIEENLWVLPVSGYDLTATFGSGGSLWSSDHTGLDFAAAYGSPVVSVARGVVTEAAYAGAYGNRVIVTHPDGTETWYCHMDSFAVSEGESVDAGTQVGAIGMSGNTTGPHLHLEVRPGGGDPVDPYSALVVHGITP
jgi:murein DD-endopeptidase MepM/ murein hydrolase activator NlpD